MADSNTLKGLVLAYNATYTNPGADCQQKFVGFYNLYMGTTYDWNSLQQLYLTVTGKLPQVCGAGGTVITVTLRTIPNPPNTINPPLLCGLNTTLFPEVKVHEPDPCDWITEMALAYAEEKYQFYIDSLKGAFDAAYFQKCISAAGTESFTVSTNDIREYHYTLYYYDQTGNLTKTVPPSGVNLSKFSDATWSTQVKTAKQNDQTLPVPHTLVTQYRYNSLNQVVEQISPDGGLSKFWYDRLGRLVFSQNAKQVLLNQYSYTKYDKLGRIEEVGQLTSSAAMTQATAQSESATITWWNTQVNNSREQITRTKYDEAQTTLCSPAPSVLCQKNLRNRVSYTYVQNSASSDNTNPPYVTATYYSYDIHGNVDVLLQHYSSGIMQSSGSNAFKRIEYKYDLISGKVNEVAYQPGYSDQFYHRYSYDAENKLTKVFTSPDRVVWEQEADYRYYRHGPLARVELGQVGVQGVDYAYTLQGWLKTVNSTAVSTTADMGGDGTLSGRKIAADVYGFALHYNSTDYKAINLSKTVVAPVTSTGLPAFKDLYNGNIAAMAVTFKHTSFGANNTSGLNQPLLYKYRYDQLNRIKEMDAYSGLNQTTNVWTFGSPLTAYQERVSYDGNGNILTYTRNGDAARTAMDNMTYSYVSGTNRLDKVVDVAPDATSNYSDYNDLRTGQLPGNYSYDAIGNLIVEKEKIGTNTVTTNITWNVYGKIASVTKSGVTTSYTYDASGNRISKTTGSKTTWYVRDASGNVMAVYESGNATVNGGNLSQIEVHLYGSSRLGMWTPNRNVQVLPAAQNTVMTGLLQPGVTRTYKRGQKFFELSNHLGNVLVTVTDRKVAIQNGTTGTILNYVADVVSGGDYYPFGMQMPSRNYSTDKYRYGFNGKEKDKEINSQTAYDYGFRIYNPTIGKFLSVDPLGKRFPFLTPYQYASNSPISFVDLDGAEASYFQFRMYAQSVEAEAALYKGNYKDMPFRLQADLFMLGMAKSATVDGLMWEMEKSIRNTFSDAPSINFNELPPEVKSELIQDAIDKSSPFGLVSLVKGVFNVGKEAISGNPEAMGNIAGGLLAWRLFKLPESELSTSASGKFLLNAKNVVGGSEEAAALIKNGVGDFKAMENVEIPISKGCEFLDDNLRMIEQPFKDGPKVQFGQTDNQIYHAFRHTDKLGLDRLIVRSAVEQDFKSVFTQVVEGESLNRIIEVGGIRIQYSAYKLKDGTFNIGRIHGVD